MEDNGGDGQQLQETDHPADTHQAADKRSEYSRAHSQLLCTMIFDLEVTFPSLTVGIEKNNLNIFDRGLTLVLEKTTFFIFVYMYRNVFLVCLGAGMGKKCQTHTLLTRQV